jgi:hypothetical protein
MKVVEVKIPQFGFKKDPFVLFLLKVNEAVGIESSQQPEL